MLRWRTGPVGRQGSAATDMQFNAEIYSTREPVACSAHRAGRKRLSRSIDRQTPALYGKAA